MNMFSSNCHKITDEALKDLLLANNHQRGRALQLLALTDTKVFKGTCLQLVEKFPFLQVHYAGHVFEKQTAMGNTPTT